MSRCFGTKRLILFLRKDFVHIPCGVYTHGQSNLIHFVLTPTNYGAYTNTEPYTRQKMLNTQSKEKASSLCSCLHSVLRFVVFFLFNLVSLFILFNITIEAFIPMARMAKHPNVRVYFIPTASLGNLGMSPSVLSPLWIYSCVAFFLYSQLNHGH